MSEDEDIETAAERLAEELSAAEKRGYGKGYRAGVERKRRETSQEELRRRKASFWNRAFLAALPACVETTSWQKGNVPIKGVDDKVELAAEFADEALKRFKF